MEILIKIFLTSFVVSLISCIDYFVQSRKQKRVEIDQNLFWEVIGFISFWLCFFSLIGIIWSY